MNNIRANDFRNFITAPRSAPRMEEIEKSINKLNGVLFSKIMLSDNQQIKEIHIITKDYCNPKKISRDIESLLIAQHNIAIDYRKISIAQVEEDKDYSKRLRFSDVIVSSKGEQLNVIVKLENKDKIYEGKIDCIDWSSNKEYIVARATLNAITSFLNGKIFFQVDEIKQFKMQGKEVMLTSVDLIDSQGKENLVGAVLVKDNTNKAVVNSILKAVNRRIFFK